MSVIAEIRQRLSVLQPTRLDLEDDSARHAGHAGAKGGGHFRLNIVSAGFTGKRTIERHRMVYDALGELMRQQVHAISITARTPDENP